jgi:hypothetical protein
MSQTLVPGRGVSTSKAGSQPIVKTTCVKCKRTIYVHVIAGAKVATDPEHIGVATKPSKGVEARRLVAHRVHDVEMCTRYVAEAERAAERKAAKRGPIASWRRIDNTTRVRSATRSATRPTLS